MPLDKYPGQNGVFEIYPGTAVPHGPHRLLGSGSLQLVYQHPYFEQLEYEGVAGARTVVKLDCSSMYLIDGATDEDLAVAAQQQRTELATRKERFEAFRHYFGPQRVPREEFGISTMYLDARQAAELFPGRVPENPCAWTQASVIDSHQAYVSEFELSPMSVRSLYVEYAEQIPDVSPTDYAVMNDWFVLGADQTGDAAEAIGSFNRTQANHDMRMLLAIAEHDGVVAQELRDLIGCCIRYSTDTGYAIDMGARNILMTTSGETKLVDALYPKNIRIVSELGGILQKVSRREILTFQERINIMNGRKYVSTVNFLARCLGLHDRLTVPSAPSSLGPRWYDVLETLRSLPRRSDLQKPTQSDGMS